MLHNDISNHRSYSFGFRVEDTLLHFKDKTALDKIKNFFVGKSNRAEVNSLVLQQMNHIFWNTEYTVILIADKSTCDDVKLMESLMQYPFNQLGMIINSVSEITMALMSGEMSYYIDDNDYRRSMVNSKYAVSSEEFRSLLKSGKFDPSHI